MSVAVISKTGERLMPASEYRARKLLKSGKAIKHSYHPFTIQLTERERILFLRRMGYPALKKMKL